MKMGYHNSSLIDSLRNADFVWWYHPEGAGFSKMKDLFRGHKKIKLFSSTDSIVESLLDEAIEGDDIVIMSNGSFNSIHNKIIHEMENKH